MWNTPMYDTTKLTLELRDLVDNGVDIWDFDYPSYYKGDEKTAFEKKVIDHYLLRQIGQETVGRFLHCFRTRVREIMPKYIDLYKSKEIMDGIEDPFGNVDIVETFEQESTGTSSGTGSTSSTLAGEGSNSNNTENNLERRFSNTPNGSIENLDNYLTEGTKEDTTNNNTGSFTNESTSTGSLDSQSTSSGTLKHTFTKKGNQGVNTYAHDMIEFRQSIIDVDMMVIDDLNCCFLGVY